MKLRNKKTGEIKEVEPITIGGFRSLAELNEEWEDYEESKEDGLDNVITLVEAYSSHDSVMYPKEIVEKLKAWKRLKDMGFKIKGIRYRNYRNYIEWDISQKVSDDNFTGEDFNGALHLLFGGEE